MLAFLHQLRRLSFVALSLCLLLAACVEPAVKPSHPLRVDLPSPERGVVIARIISNDHQLSEFFQQWNKLTIQRVDDEEKQVFILDAVESGWSSTALFVGILPAGDYEVRALRAVNEQLYSSAWLQQSFPSGLRRFRVAGSRYTDLGTVVYQSIHGPTRNSDFALLYREQDPISMVALVEELFPAIGARVQNKSALSWSEEATAESSQLPQPLQQLIRTAAIPTAAPQLGPDGQILLPARLGQIHGRDARGRWQTYDTGFRFALHHVSYAEGVGYLASGESGLILRAENLTGPWQVSVGGIKANGTALGLYQHQDGHWYQVLQVGQEATSLDWISLNQRTFGRTHHEIYRSSSLQQPQWMPVSLPQPQAQLAMQDARFFLRTSEGLLFRYQTNGTWAEAGNAPFAHIALDDAGQLYSYADDLANRRGMLAAGDGVAWQEESQLYFTSLPQHLDESEYVIARPPLSLTSTTTTLPALEAALFVRNRGQTSWQQGISVPAACTLEASLHVLHQQLWALCQQTQLYRLEQERWVLEWQPNLDAQLFRQHRIEQTAFQL